MMLIQVAAAIRFVLQHSPASQEKPFPVRSVPKSLEKAAADSYEKLAEQGIERRDLIQAVFAVMGHLSMAYVFKLGARHAWIRICFISTCPWPQKQESYIHP